MIKPMKTLVLIGVVIVAELAGLLWSGELPIIGSNLVNEAQAVVGRPLTPMSYAGVARRTVRRCRAGVYYC
jgi:hypothetical protein